MPSYDVVVKVECTDVADEEVQGIGAALRANHLGDLDMGDVTKTGRLKASVSLRSDVATAGIAASQALVAIEQGLRQGVAHRLDVVEKLTVTVTPAKA